MAASMALAGNDQGTIKNGAPLATVVRPEVSAEL